jgi:hypothetical protein
MGGFILRHRVTVFLALVFAVASTAAVFSVMAYAATGHTAAASLSNVKISKFDATDTNLGNSGTCGPSDNWADIPGMTKTFKLGGTGSRPVTVTYSGGVEFVGGLGGSFLRLLVDGTQEGAGTYEIEEGANSNTFSTTGFTALTPPLTPGNHTVEIQSDPASDLCFIGPQTLVIFHS